MTTEIRIEHHKIAQVLNITLNPSINNRETSSNYEANQYNLHIYFDDGSRIGYGFTKNQSKKDIAIAMIELAKEILQLSEG